ncbi:hypothetical protein GTZ78_28475 [Streptomyces sp. SID8361]|uniref:hypothetical protein n=1 Tax=Streptomyces sp. MnatMP-M27 TaxID=1839768 RepID=UPI00081D864F|nr:hypothetical protein [Streptomyces sp. MnatMP-M27]MYU14510.1 hypothetical protein [Streptomyces sp. SID8361]SCG06236.1 hypothetical protein GA0115260_1079424 [Streptomyces sp. MnatMP-M27]
MVPLGGTGLAGGIDPAKLGLQINAEYKRVEVTADGYFSEGPKKTDQQMAEADVTEEQLAKGNEPESHLLRRSRSCCLKQSPASAR